MKDRNPELKPNPYPSTCKELSRGWFDVMKGDTPYVDCSHKTGISPLWADVIVRDTPAVGCRHIRGYPSVDTLHKRGIPPPWTDVMRRR